MRAAAFGFWWRALVAASLAGGLLLAGCSKKPNPSSRAVDALPAPAWAAGADLSEREIPAPEVFSLIDMGLWDGRPSLGGIWVAHPEVRAPERVLIRHLKTGAEVRGAVFRRERYNPGPPFQISSEAAAHLGILAGQPTEIEVIALRREPVTPVETTPAAEDPAHVRPPGDARENSTSKAPWWQFWSRETLSERRADPNAQGPRHGGVEAEAWSEGHETRPPEPGFSLAAFFPPGLRQRADETPTLIPVASDPELLIAAPSEPEKATEPGFLNRFVAFLRSLRG